MNFGNLIKEARETRGWRQEDLANRLQVTQQAVQKWEMAVLPPLRSPYLSELCDLLGLELPSADEIRTQTLNERHAFISRTSPRRTGGAHIHTPDELIEHLKHIAPPELQGHVGGVRLHKGLKMRFTYASRRLVAHAIYGTPNGASLVTYRNAAWRLAVAKGAAGDFDIVSSSHYLLAVLNLPDGTDDTSRLPSYVPLESAALGIHIESLPDLNAFLARIQELEAKPTDREQLEETMNQFDDTEAF